MQRREVGGKAIKICEYSNSCCVLWKQWKQPRPGQGNFWSWDYLVTFWVAFLWMRWMRLDRQDRQIEEQQVERDVEEGRRRKEWIDRSSFPIHRVIIKSMQHTTYFRHWCGLQYLWKLSIKNSLQLTQLLSPGSGWFGWTPAWIIINRCIVWCLYCSAAKYSIWDSHMGRYFY